MKKIRIHSFPRQWVDGVEKSFDVNETCVASPENPVYIALEKGHWAGSGVYLVEGTVTLLARGNGYNYQVAEMSQNVKYVPEHGLKKGRKAVLSSGLAGSQHFVWPD